MSTFSVQNPMTNCPVCNRQLIEVSNLALCLDEHYQEEWIVKNGSLYRKVKVNGQSQCEYPPYDLETPWLEEIQQDIEQAITEAQVKFKE